MSNQQNKSIKHQQSEAGVTGEYSPNLDMVDEIHDKLHNEFQHVHDTVTNDDCFIFLSANLLGKKVDGSGSHFHTVVGSKGCQHNLVALLATVFSDCDYLADAAAQALIVAFRRK